MSITLVIREYVLQGKDIDEQLNRCTEIGIEGSEEIFEYTEKLRDSLVDQADSQRGQELANNTQKRCILHHGKEQERSNANNGAGQCEK
jgi:hypothetical protein